jgi:hypothetical protein
VKGLNFSNCILAQVSCKTNINQQTIVTQKKHILNFASKNCIAKNLRQIKLPHHAKDALHAITHIHLHMQIAKGEKFLGKHSNR